MFLRSKPNCTRVRTRSILGVTGKDLGPLVECKLRNKSRIERLPAVLAQSLEGSRNVQSSLCLGQGHIAS